MQDKGLCVYDRKYNYKYLGKSLSLSGEDRKQVSEFMNAYYDLLEKIAACELPLSLKASAFNNMALSKVLHHFYNTRLTAEQLVEMDQRFTEKVRDSDDSDSKFP